jgi:hypothetical protein
MGSAWEVEAKEEDEDIAGAFFLWVRTCSAGSGLTKSALRDCIVEAAWSGRRRGAAPTWGGDWRNAFEAARGGGGGVVAVVNRRVGPEPEPESQFNGWRRICVAVVVGERILSHAELSCDGGDETKSLAKGRGCEAGREAEEARLGVPSLVGQGLEVRMSTFHGAAMTASMCGMWDRQRSVLRTPGEYGVCGFWRPSQSSGLPQPLDSGYGTEPHEWAAHIANDDTKTWLWPIIFIASA